MKEKLKILFGFLRGLRTKIVQTSFVFDREYIEDSDDKFKIDQNRSVKIPSFIEKILEELVNSFYYEFRTYVDLDVDDYWYLYIDIYPNENRLVFQASHKQEENEPFSRRFNYDEMNKEVQDNIDYLYSEYSDTAHFDFEMYGRWDDGEVYEFKVDNRITKITAELDEKLWQIGNNLMKTITGDRYWNEGPGADLDCRIWGDDIIVKGNIKIQDYVDSGMFLELTLDNIKNFEDDEEEV